MEVNLFLWGFIEDIVFPQCITSFFIIGIFDFDIKNRFASSNFEESNLEKII